MQTYDAVLKTLLTSSDAFIHRLAHVTVTQWLNVELPRVQAPRVHLLGRTTEEELLHIELPPSRNWPYLPDYGNSVVFLRMSPPQCPSPKVSWTTIFSALSSNEVSNKAVRKVYKAVLTRGVENVLRRLMEKRFGPLPSWANTRLTA